jgi:exosortase A-associated hydrolase 2
MNETPLFFHGNSYNLFGILHYPHTTVIKGGFVFCHPFAEEKLWAHRVFVSFARKLAASGFAVLRFDYMGHCDSEGDFKESTVETRLADIDRAIEKIKSEIQGLERVNLFGLRFGATLAALTAENRGDIEKLILCEPIIDGSRYIQEILRSNLTTQLAVFGKVSKNREQLIRDMKSGQTTNVDGYEISYALFEQVSAINLVENIKQYSGASLILQISKEGQPLRNEILKLSDCYKDKVIKLCVEEPFWRETKHYYGHAFNLYDESLDWLSH